MSTKMSNDLNISRPSSRVSRPPGGGSSISFGDSESRHTVPTPSKVVKIDQSDVSVSNIDVVKEPKVVKKCDGKVGVLIAGTIASEFLRDTIAKALTIEGIFDGSVFVTVDQISVLPYAAQNLAKSCDVVIAAAFLTEQTHVWENALLQVGVVGKVPILPALIQQESLLEAKAILPNLAEEWAKSARTVLELGFLEVVAIPAPEIKEVPVISPAVTSTDVLLEILRESLKKRGATGIIGLGRKFRIADDNHSGTVDFAEFSKVTHEHALDWSPLQIRSLFDHFDKDKSGCISFDEFVQGLRGELNERRKQLVLMAFEILDSDKSGVIELNDIQAKYDASKHPDVISGKRSKDAILREFLDTFDSEEKDGKVTPAEFCQYYGNVSASIDSDDYFELMIRNAWHISGGEGWCANSSCRRVLVTHKDGRQTVEEIKNDLGIGADDKEAMLAKLVEQGITDIESIETASGAKKQATEHAPTPSVSVAAGSKPVSGEQTTRPATAPSAINPRRQPGGASTFTLG